MLALAVIRNKDCVDGFLLHNDEVMPVKYDILLYHFGASLHRDISNP